MNRSPLIYAFGHLVDSYSDDAHAADSADLAEEVFTELGLSNEEQFRLEAIAEHVAGNYQYTGEVEEQTRRIMAGEV